MKPLERNSFFPRNEKNEGGNKFSNSQGTVGGSGKSSKEVSKSPGTPRRKKHPIAEHGIHRYLITKPNITNNSTSQTTSIQKLNGIAQPQGAEKMNNIVPHNELFSSSTEKTMLEKNSDDEHSGAAYKKLNRVLKQFPRDKEIIKLAKIIHENKAGVNDNQLNSSGDTLQNLITYASHANDIRASLSHSKEQLHRNNDERKAMGNNLFKRKKASLKQDEKDVEAIHAYSSKYPHPLNIYRQTNNVSREKKSKPGMLKKVNKSSKINRNQVIQHPVHPSKKSDPDVGSLDSYSKQRLLPNADIVEALSNNTNNAMENLQFQMRRNSKGSPRKYDTIKGLKYQEENSRNQAVRDYKSEQEKELKRIHHTQLEDSIERRTLPSATQIRGKAAEEHLQNYGKLMNSMKPHSGGNTIIPHGKGDDLLVLKKSLLNPMDSSHLLRSRNQNLNNYTNYGTSGRNKMGNRNNQFCTAGANTNNAGSNYWNLSSQAYSNTKINNKLPMTSLTSSHQSQARKPIIDLNPKAMPPPIPQNQKPSKTQKFLFNTNGRQNKLRPTNSKERVVTKLLKENESGDKIGIRELLPRPPNPLNYTHLPYDDDVDDYKDDYKQNNYTETNVTSHKEKMQFPGKVVRKPGSRLNKDRLQKLEEKVNQLQNEIQKLEYNNSQIHELTPEENMIHSTTGGIGGEMAEEMRFDTLPVKNLDDANYEDLHELKLSRKVNSRPEENCLKGSRKSKVGKMKINDELLLNEEGVLEFNESILNFQLKKDKEKNVQISPLKPKKQKGSPNKQIFNPNVTTEVENLQSQKELFPSDLIQVIDSNISQKTRNQNIYNANTMLVKKNGTKYHLNPVQYKTQIISNKEGAERTQPYQNLVAAGKKFQINFPQLNEKVKDSKSPPMISGKGNGKGEPNYKLYPYNNTVGAGSSYQNKHQNEKELNEYLKNTNQRAAQSPHNLQNAILQIKNNSPQVLTKLSNKDEKLEDKIMHIKKEIYGKDEEKTNSKKDANSNRKNGKDKNFRNNVEESKESLKRMELRSTTGGIGGVSPILNDSSTANKMDSKIEIEQFKKKTNQTEEENLNPKNKLEEKNRNQLKIVKEIMDKENADAIEKVKKYKMENKIEDFKDNLSKKDILKRLSKSSLQRMNVKKDEKEFSSPHSLQSHDSDGNLTVIEKDCDNDYDLIFKSLRSMYNF